MRYHSENSVIAGITSKICKLLTAQVYRLIFAFFKNLLWLEEYDSVLNNYD